MAGINRFACQATIGVQQRDTSYPPNNLEAATLQTKKMRHLMGRGTRPAETRGGRGLVRVSPDVKEENGLQTAVGC